MLPKAIRRPGEALFLPAMPGEVVSDDSGGRALEGQKPTAMIAAQVLGRELVPVIWRGEAQLLSQPVQVALSIGPLVPKTIRNLKKAPLLPGIVQQIIFEDLNGVTAKIDQEPSSPIPLQIIATQVIPVFNFDDAQLFA